MFDLIMEYLAWIILLILSLILYVFLTGRLYPKLFLKPSYGVTGMSDRGIRKFRFPNGRAITYVPSLGVRRFIKSYVLSSVDGEKYIQCELDDRIEDIKYDAVIYDANDRAVRVVSVTDPIRTRGKTRPALLPSDTAYVQLILRQVNGVTFSGETVAVIPKIRILIYILLTAVTSAAEALFLQSKLLELADDLFSYAPVKAEEIFLPTFLTALIIGALCASVAALIRNFCNRLQH